ncbi:hypothetical protein ElyMa_000950900 [Elysia marginata]|uniref:Uncharacterized protein n=1 Tax=Elysia marginata TaxID=1093978 RepID=A0AAV4HGE7_9GAST|nr:hypothetical protein ElyMa_000950900 [Elysia marginata]
MSYDVWRRGLVVDTLDFGSGRSEVHALAGQVGGSVLDEKLAGRVEGVADYRLISSERSYQNSRVMRSSRCCVSSESYMEEPM